MHLSPLRHSLAAAVLAIALAGCQATPAAMPGTRLAFGVAADEPAAQPVAIAAQPVAAAPQAPTAPVAAPLVAPPPVVAAPSGSAGSSHHSAPLPTGSVTVDLSALVPEAPAAQRRVLSTLSSIESLVITISMAGQPDRVKTVTGAEMRAGTKAVTIDNLPIGQCTITIEAFNATNVSMGKSSRPTAVGADKATKAQITTYVVPNDGSGYMYATSFVFGVELEAAPQELPPDGSGPASGTILATLDNAGVGNLPLYADNAGHLYVRTFGGFLGSSITTRTTKFAVSDLSRLSTVQHPGATVPVVFPMVYDPVHAKTLYGTFIGANLPDGADYRFVKADVGYFAVNSMTLSATGDAYYFLKRVVQKESAGTITPTTIPGIVTMALDQGENIWVGHPADANTQVTNQVRKYAQDGTLLATITLPFNAVRLLSDGADGMWVCDRPGGQFAHISADGTLGPALGIPANDVCVDAHRNVWVSGASSLYKLGPDGMELARYPLKVTYLAAGDGFLFARMDNQTVLKIQP